MRGFSIASELINLRTSQVAAYSRARIIQGNMVTMQLKITLHYTILVYAFCTVLANSHD